MSGFGTLLAVLTLCSGAGYGASRLGLTMPWFLGPLLFAVVLVRVPPDRFRPSVDIPLWLRSMFIVVIGMMIGATFSRELLLTVPQWWPSLLGVVLFTVVAQVVAFAIYQRVPGVNDATAWYSGTPGGLIESVTLGKEAGGDGATIALLQFLRVILVVSLLPVLVSLWTGEQTASSSATLSATNTPVSLGSVVVLLLLGGCGWAASRVIKLPAGILIWPMILTAISQLAFPKSAQVPANLVILAQIVIGTSLGLRFRDLRSESIAKSVKYCLVAVGVLLALTLAFSLGLSQVTEAGLLLLVISFAPAGVVEMGLIALALGANPVVVTTHHLLRIFVSVLALPFLSRFFIR